MFSDRSRAAPWRGPCSAPVGPANVGRTEDTTMGSVTREHSRPRAVLAELLLVTAVGGGRWCAAADEPAPDPSGLATVDNTSVYDAGGNSCVVAEPTDEKASDFAEKKKAYDEYTAAAEKEPLAVKLADAVGHVRVATNTAWTLNTGYLVLFMQAGFALLTCGLVRKKNAGHLMMLNFAAYVFAFLAY